MERYFSNAQFVERKDEISNFDQGNLSHYLMCGRGSNYYSADVQNHIMSDMEQMKHSINGLKTPTRMLLDASTEGTLRIKNEDEVKTLIESMFQNGYCNTLLNYPKLFN